MTRAIVLGAGMVGRTMAVDLIGDADFDVAIADVNTASLREIDESDRGITTVEADLSDSASVKRLVADYDVVLGALSSRIGFSTLRSVIEAGRPYCDISFMPDDALELDELAKEHGVTAVADCGVAPGLSNLLVGYADSQLESLTNVRIDVGGVPRERNWPFEYKAGFAPSDVIEEYTRPARVVVNGRTVVQPALTDAELIDFPGVGTLESFVTDGLRSLIDTITADHMVEKTMRYPGHAELMRVLRHMGLFGEEPIRLPGNPSVEVRPIDVTSALLFPVWKYEPGEADLTIMRVIVEGIDRDGKATRFSWSLFDEFDQETQTTSMSRTTAFPATIVARMLVDGSFSRPGVNPPEFVGREPGLADRVLAELNQRGICVESTQGSSD